MIAAARMTGGLALAPGAPPVAPGARRAFFTSSSCGICGKASIEAVRTTSVHDLTTDRCRVSRATLAALPGALREAQRVFDSTGGLHAAGLFDAATGEVIEDQA